LRQFDVLESAVDTSRAYAPYLVVLQSHHLTPLKTVFVAPLIADLEETLTGLHVPISFRGQGWMLAIPQSAGVHRSLLGRLVGSVAEYEDQIRRAFERLLSGF
jgi:toxin CcdB